MAFSYYVHLMQYIELKQEEERAGDTCGYCVANNF
jgi:hypothetical protein